MSLGSLSRELLDLITDRPRYVSQRGKKEGLSVFDSQGTVELSVSGNLLDLFKN